MIKMLLQCKSQSSLLNQLIVIQTNWFIKNLSKPPKTKLSKQGPKRAQNKIKLTMTRFSAWESFCITTRVWLLDILWPLAKLGVELTTLVYFWYADHHYWAILLTGSILMPGIIEVRTMYKFGNTILGIYVMEGSDFVWGFYHDKI